MHGHGIAGALWSAVRRLASVSGGIRASVAVLMAVAALCMPQQAHGTIITATVTGTVASGTDADGLFGQVGSLAGDPYTVVYTIDDTKGTGTVKDFFSTPVQLGSHIYSTATSNPITAAATINNGPPISFDMGGATALGSNQVSRSILNGISSLAFSVSSSNPAANSGDRLTIGASSLVNAPFTTDPNWEAPLSANAPFSFLGTEGVLQYATFSNGVATQQVSASLNISNITIGQPVMPPPPPCASIVNNAVATPTLLTTPQNNVIAQIASGDTRIVTSFTPANGSLTLSQAAAACGFSDFNWVQIATIPAPSPSSTNANPTTPIVGKTNDPPPSGFYNYPSGNNNSYPYLLDPNANALFNYSLAFQKIQATASCISGPYVPGDGTLCFSDAPADPCLPPTYAQVAGFAIPIPVGGYAPAPNSQLKATSPSTCGNQPPAAPGTVLSFETALVGMVPVGTVCPPDGGTCFEQDPSNNGAPSAFAPGSTCDPTGISGVSCYETLVGISGQPTDYFNWTDSFNGTAGGIAVLSNPGEVDPDSGAGGITITSVNGIPISGIPEPPATAFLVIGWVGLLVVRYKAVSLVRRNSDRKSDNRLALQLRETELLTV